MSAHGAETHTRSVGQVENRTKSPSKLAKRRNEIKYPSLCTIFQQPAKALLANLVPIPSDKYRPQFADVGALAEEYGFHKAIRYLAGGPSWRMKKCENENCSRRFVADHNERKCCSTRCSSEHQSDRQKKWGRENNWGRPGPAKAKTRKSSPRLPGSRSKKPDARPMSKRSR